MTRKLYDSRKRFNKCVRCGEFVDVVKYVLVQRGLSSFLTIEQVSQLDATLAEDFEPDADGGYDFVHAEDACPTCIVQLMAANA